MWLRFGLSLRHLLRLFLLLSVGEADDAAADASAHAAVDALLSTLSCGGLVLVVIILSLVNNEGATND